MSQTNQISIIGGGASGVFAAIQLKEKFPKAKVTIYEKNRHLLEKVRISGGGRCNVTNAQTDPELLSENYPRGKRKLKGLFYEFGSAEMQTWLQNEGVSLKAEQDGRVFPTSDDSQTIIWCFVKLLKKYNITVELNARVSDIEATDTGWQFQVNKTENIETEHLLLAVGGLKKGHFLDKFPIKIKPLIPSLFAFNVVHHSLKSLSGLSLPNVKLKIEGIKKSVEPAPMLITHRGVSGPAVLKSSAFFAEELASKNYQFKIKIQWLGDRSEDDWDKFCQTNRKEFSKKKITNTPWGIIPKRLWEFLIQLAKIPTAVSWANLSKSQQQRLKNLCFAFEMQVDGKTTNKDEFVTAGGIALSEVKFPQMELKKIPKLYAVGEALDIDGVTGGFNFQAAWTTAYHWAKYLELD